MHGGNTLYERFSTVYDRLMRDVDYDAWARCLDGLIRGFQPASANAILECACGTGELTWRLDQIGYNVVASDLSADMLRVAEEKCRKRGLRIPFVCQDMTKLSFERPFDAVIAACDGVNYLLTDRALHDFFRSAWDCLKPGGLLLFDVSSAYKLENVLGLNTFADDGEDVAYIWKNMYDPKSALLEMNLSFFVRKNGVYERFGEKQLQRAYTVAELTRALNDCGYDILGAYEAFTDNAAAPDSERIQMIARKNDHA